MVLSTMTDIKKQFGETGEAHLQDWKKETLLGKVEREKSWLERSLLGLQKAEPLFPFLP